MNSRGRLSKTTLREEEYDDDEDIGEELVDGGGFCARETTAREKRYQQPALEAGAGVHESVVHGTHHQTPQCKPHQSLDHAHHTHQPQAPLRPLSSRCSSSTSSRSTGLSPLCSPHRLQQPQLTPSPPPPPATSVYVNVEPPTHVTVKLLKPTQVKHRCPQPPQGHNPYGGVGSIKDGGDTGEPHLPSVTRASSKFRKMVASCRSPTSTAHN